jgi:PEP-CTERM motif
MRAQIRKTLLAATASLVATFLVGISGATAGVINIGNGAGGSDPTGTSCPPCDPVLVGNGGDVSIEVQGSASIANQVLLGILIPNDTTDLFGGVNPLGTITLYGAFPGASTGTGSSAFTGSGFGLGSGTAAYNGNGFWGPYDTTTNTFLNAFLDSSFNNSNNSSNFVAFDNSLGVPALTDVVDFGVYTIAITTGPLAPNKGKVGLVDIQIPGDLPDGSILVALDDNLNSTVWTNAGGVNQPSIIPDIPADVPEPASLAILSAGLVAFGLFRRKVRPH